MRNFLLLGLCIVTALGFTSCASYTKDAALMQIQNNTIETAVAADLDLENAKIVTADVNKQILFGFINLDQDRTNKALHNVNRYKGLNKLERVALYKATENSDVDVILEPTFVTEKHSWFFGVYKTRRVSVKGWGVKIKGLKEGKATYSY